MDDRPRLVKAIDEHARRLGRASLVKNATDTQIPVGQRHRRLGPRRESRRPARFDDAPLVRREEVFWRHDNPALRHRQDRTAAGRIGWRVAVGVGGHEDLPAGGHEAVPTRGHGPLMRVPVEKASATQARAAFLLRSRHGGWPLTEETRIDPCGAAVYSVSTCVLRFSRAGVQCSKGHTPQTCQVTKGQIMLRTGQHDGGLQAA